MRCEALVARRGSAQALGGAGLPGRRALKCRPLRYSPTPAQNRAKALFRSKAPALLRSSGDAPKAGHLRPTLARETVSLVGGKREKHLTLRGNVATAAAGADAPPLSRRPRSGADAGQSAKPCFSPVSPRRLRVPQGRHFSARRRRRCSCASRCCTGARTDAATRLPQRPDHLTAGWAFVLCGRNRQR